MTNEVDFDPNKLFNEISTAIRADDGNKLSELTTTPALEKEEEPLETEVPAEEEEQPEEVKEEEEKSPPEDDKAGKTEEETEEEGEKVVEKSELDLLKEQLNRVTKENHNLKSQAGRVPHVQKRLRELDKKLEELERKSTSPSSQTSEKIKPQVDAILKGIRETDAELADAVAKAIAVATEGVAAESLTKEKDTLVFLRQQELEQHQEMEAQRLLDMYPNAPEVFQSKHWSDWKSQQSAGVVGLANSDSADDVALAFEKYARDMQALFPELQSEQKAVKPAANDDATEKARQIEEERLKRRSTAASIGSPNAAGKIAVSDDPQALFEKYVKEIRKSRE
jgi:ElaB/YqjD/DUF883 family membrane-anchored ribosome-binding protein